MSARKGNLREEALALYRLGVLCENVEAYREASSYFERFWKVVIGSGDLLGIGSYGPKTYKNRRSTCV